MSDKKNFNFFHNKKIAFLGLGEENFSLLKFLLKRKNLTPALSLLRRGRLVICDPKSAAELGDRFLEIKELARKNKLLEINLMTGKDYDAHLADFDIVFRSPGYPLFNKNLIKAKKAGVIISSPMKLFFELCPTKNIIGVTGSKGKGTTSSLIYEVLRAANIPRPPRADTPLNRGDLTSPQPSPCKGEGASVPSPLQGEGQDEVGVFLGGNIGIAPFDFIEKINSGDFVVLELSSFQLEDLEKSPHIAVITNIFKEHLAPADPNNPNYHKSMKVYWEAKANIFKYQKKSDYLVVSEILKSRVMPAKAGIQKLISAVKLDSLPTGRQATRGYSRENGDWNDMIGKIIFYDKSDLPSNLIGEHNQKNIAAAEAVAKILKIKPEIVARAVKKFKGLPHRLELVTEINGVKYFDDSFATVPEVSVIALKALTSPQPSPCKGEGASVPSSLQGEGQDEVKKINFPKKCFDKNIILLAGGADKGSDFGQFAKEIKKRVKYLILFKGAGTDKLKKMLCVMCCVLFKEVNNMKEAIAIAKKQSKPGDIVLLSTGCASFGCFKNYKDRGEQFKKEVLKK